MTLVRSDGQRKRVFIRTYGCQMNVYDSDRMADVLRPLGYALSDSPAQADLVVLNTCHIREHASEKVYSELGRLRDEKQLRRAEGRDLTIAVAGCVAQAEGEEIVRRQPAVDIVVGPQSYHRLPQLLAEVDAQPRSCAPAAPPGAAFSTRSSAESKFEPASRACVRVRRSCRSRKAATSSAPFASCPTRAARSIRGRRRPC